MRPLLIEGMHGLGDNLYQRAVLRALGWEGVYLATPWPELYADMPIKCVRPNTKLRTQGKNVRRQPASSWHAAPAGATVRRWHYAARKGVSITEALLDDLGEARRPAEFVPPPVGAFTPGGSPYVFFRPATIRAEWRADARNPDPQYLARGVAAAVEAGLRAYGFADLHGRDEWLAPGPQPRLDGRWYAGEVHPADLMGAFARAACAVGGPGWVVPAALTFGTPLLLVFGGWGADNGPERLLGPLVGGHRIFPAMPDEFCRCSSWGHACNKTISGFDHDARLFATRFADRRSADLAA